MEINLEVGAKPPEMGATIKIVVLENGEPRVLGTQYVTGLRVSGHIGSSSGPDGSTTYYQGYYIVTTRGRPVPLDDDLEVPNS